MEAGPTLSLRERDRRWELVRELIRRCDLTCLIVGSFRGRERHESYLIDDHLDGVVLFPLEGEPTVLTWSTTRISRALESFRRGVKPWVSDIRVGFGGTKIASLIQEKGLGKTRVGVVGLGQTGAGEREGIIPYTFWANVLKELPEATFEDISWEFAEIMLVKSAEELALLRHAARVSEAACQVMLNVTRPGVGEEVIYAEVMREIFCHACEPRSPMMSLQSGPSNIAWGPPRWLVRAEHPRRVVKGDMVQAEIHTSYGGQEAQVQMSIAVDPIDEFNRRCEEVAQRSYEAGLRVLRAGITFAELIHAMEEPLREAGCWAKTPLAHSLTFGPGGFTGINRDQLKGTQEEEIEGRIKPGIRKGELVLRSGMTLELEPNACIGTNRVNLGAAVIITETGFEELNTLPTRVQHVA